MGSYDGRAKHRQLAFTERRPPTVCMTGLMKAETTVRTENLITVLAFEAVLILRTMRADVIRVGEKSP